MGNHHHARKPVTDRVDFENNDDECLPLTKCACGMRYESWEFIISIYRDFATRCDCGRQLYFRNSIRVYEVIDD